VSVAAPGSDSGEPLSRVTAALAAAEIPPSKLGPTRWARLSEAERELHFWILRRFANEGAQPRVDLRAAARKLGLEVDTAFEMLAREDLIHRGTDGEIEVAYPFSGRPTIHRVRFPGGHEVDAMCAIYAFGIAPMFAEQVDIEPRDPATGDEIHVRVAPDGPVEWSPQSAVVVAGASRSQGNACSGCCPVLNFFASAANAERWLGEHPEVRGNVISMREAAAAGRAVFGDVLTAT
jgi:alkylmercury lyase